MTEEQTSQASAKKAVATSIGVVLFTIAATFAMDRWSKAWALGNLTLHNSQPFIEGFLKLTLTTNTGAAFSLGSNNFAFMTITAVVLTAALSFWLGSRIARGQAVPILELIGLSCIIGGSLGNLTDRFTQGHVTDFLDFAFFSFPVFNAADTFINIGLGLVLIARLGKGDGNTEEHTKENSNGMPAAASKPEDTTTAPVSPEKS